MRFITTVRIEVETNDQPSKDVRARLSNTPHRVGQWIAASARKATEEAIYVFGPEDYFPDWPEDGKRAEVVRVTQRTVRA